MDEVSLVDRKRERRDLRFSVLALVVLERPSPSASGGAVEIRFRGLGVAAVVGVSFS